LNGEDSSINTMPMLNIWTPPPDIYNIKACIGSDLAGEKARSQARFSFRRSYSSGEVFVTAFEEPLCYKFPNIQEIFTIQSQTTHRGNRFGEARGWR